MTRRRGGERKERKEREEREERDWGREGLRKGLREGFSLDGEGKKDENAFSFTLTRMTSPSSSVCRA